VLPGQASVLPQPASARLSPALPEQLQDSQVPPLAWPVLLQEVQPYWW